MNRVPPEKVACPYVVLRFDGKFFRPDDPGSGFTVVSLFDDKLRAEADVARLQALNGAKGCVYFVQRSKKYFRRQGEPDVPAVKDTGQANPLASAWRPTIRAIVDAFVAGDFVLGSPISGATIDRATAGQVQAALTSYGGSLCALPEDTWKTSVAQWTQRV